MEHKTLVTKNLNSSQTYTYIDVKPLENILGCQWKEVYIYLPQSKLNPAKFSATLVRMFPPSTK
jgi:hypothetical protein